MFVIRSVHIWIDSYKYKYGLNTVESAEEDGRLQERVTQTQKIRREFLMLLKNRGGGLIPLHAHFQSCMICRYGWVSLECVRSAQNVYSSNVCKFNESERIILILTSRSFSRLQSISQCEVILTSSVIYILLENVYQHCISLLGNAQWPLWL